MKFYEVMRKNEVNFYVIILNKECATRHVKCKRCRGVGIACIAGVVCSMLPCT